MKKTKKNETEELEKIIAQSELMATKQRLGLFSMPVPLAIGAQTFKPKRANKDQDGKVIIQKRGIYTASARKGILPKDLFDGSTHLTDGKFSDPYVDPGRKSRFIQSLPRKRVTQRRKTVKGKFHKDPFYLSTAKWGEYRIDRKLRYGNPYEFFSRKERKTKRKIKDADGKVIIGGVRVEQLMGRKTGNLRPKVQKQDHRRPVRREISEAHERADERFEKENDHRISQMERVL